MSGPKPETANRLPLSADCYPTSPLLIFAICNLLSDMARPARSAPGFALTRVGGRPRLTVYGSRFTVYGSGSENGYRPR